MTANGTGPDLDLLHGVTAIARYLCMTDKQVYHLHGSRQLSTFKMGKTVCARRSTLTAHFAVQEAAAPVAIMTLPEPRPRNRRPGRAPGRPASVIIGAAAIGARLGIDAAAVVQMDAARAIPTYIADGLLCALASELDIYLAKEAR